MIRAAGCAPCAIDASMNSFSRSDSTCPRSGRPTYGISTYEITSVGIQRLPLSMLIGPQWRPLIASAAPSAIASRITGNAQMRSKKRVITPVGPAAVVAGEQREDDREEACRSAPSRCRP